MTLGFRTERTADDNGTWLVTVPALPEVTTYAETDAEIVDRARDAIEEAISARISQGGTLPAGDSDAVADVKLPLLTELKIGLYVAARDRDVTRAELARRLGWNRESVDRLFRLDHLSRLGQVEDAYRALGLSLRVEALAAA